MAQAPTDWLAYLQANPDLGAAGIKDAAGAQQHWNQYGQYENRNTGVSASAAVQPRMPNYADDGKMYAGGNPYFDESAGGDFVPGVTQPPPPGGMVGGFNNGWGTTGGQQSGGLTIGGKTYTQQQVQDFYKNGGNERQFLEQNGITDPWQARDLTLQARQTAGYKPTMQQNFQNYQKDNPGGAFANDYNGWLNDMKNGSPGVYNAMQAGTYTGANTAAKDFDVGGIYYGRNVDFKNSGKGRLGIGDGWGDPSATAGGGSGGYSGGYGGGSGASWGAAWNPGSSAGSQGVNGMSNPYLQPQADAIRGQYARALTEDVLPTINQGAVAAGGYGGTRQALAQGKAINGMGLNLASALSNMYGNSYQFDQGNFTNQRGQDMNSYTANRQLDQNGVQLGANLYNMGNSGSLTQGQGLYNIGSTDQNAMWQLLQNLSNLTGPYTGLNSTSTVNGTNSGSTLGNILGGATLGQKIYNGWGTGSGGMSMVNGGGFSNTPLYLLG